MCSRTTTISSRRGGFSAEFAAAWQQFPDKGLFFGLLAVWAALFHFLGSSTFGYVASPSLFRWLHVAYTWQGSEDGHGLLIPFVVVGLFWWKRQVLLDTPKGTWLPGLIFLAGGVVLHVLGYLVQQPRVSVVAFFGGVYALLALVWGWRFVVACFFPFVLLAFCIPVGSLAEPLTVPLRKVSTDIAVFTVRDLLGIPVVQEGVQIMDPRGTYTYEVAAACSGIRSLVTLVALTTIYGFTTFTRTWKRLLMVALALPLALLGNVLRLMTIIVAAEAFGHAAGEFAHDWFGFLTFALALAAMLGLGHWLREPAPVVGAAMTPKTA